MSTAADDLDARGTNLITLAAHEPDRDPLAAVFKLGERHAKVGLVLGLLIAFSLHGYAAGLAMMSLLEMRRAVDAMRHDLHDFFWTEYDVDLTPQKEQEKPAEKPPEPAPEPEPVPPPPAPKAVEPAPAKEPDPYDPPPAPAQAPKILAQEPDPEEPVDLTGQGFVQGDGSGPGYGMVSSAGTSDVPTFNKKASNDGVPGGKGTGSNTPPAPQGRDMSKPAGLVGSSSWDCPFPPEADAEQIDQAVVTIIVTVRPDGSAQSVKVVDDPAGHGFGRSARVCALSRRYTPALDRTGTPTLSATPPIKVRFTR